ncbi:hypothetical protein GGQ73_004431 [Rhizobium skierniewicense]|uniref:Uncharacterized protein n=1 Tax=Rhizobium skierniewicense TaxID=984260 RepID=A0A7W6CC99_9HYPH|nr:hypothetical protein [Rhizobium skierniewicense]MBB3948444.1 hypothetical protein [Rhizobium skierniewicense]
MNSDKSSNDDSGSGERQALSLDADMQPKFFSHQFNSNFMGHNSVDHFRPKSFVKQTVYGIMWLSEAQNRQVAKTLASVIKGSRTVVEKEYKIERPPGHRAIGILQAVLPKSVFERVYGQMVADSRAEFYEALDKNDYLEAKKIKRHLNYSLILSALTYVVGLPFHLLSKCFNWYDKSE